MAYQQGSSDINMPPPQYGNEPANVVSPEYSPENKPPAGGGEVVFSTQNDNAPYDPSLEGVEVICQDTEASVRRGFVSKTLTLVALMLGFTALFTFSYRTYWTCKAFPDDFGTVNKWWEDELKQVEKQVALDLDSKAEPEAKKIHAENRMLRQLTILGGGLPRQMDTAHAKADDIAKSMKGSERYFLDMQEYLTTNYWASYYAQEPTGLEYIKAHAADYDSSKADDQHFKLPSDFKVDNGKRNKPTNQQFASVMAKYAAQLPKDDKGAYKPNRLMRMAYASHHVDSVGFILTLAWVGILGALFICIPVCFCCTCCMRSYPLNYVLLSFFCLCFTFIVNAGATCLDLCGCTQIGLAAVIVTTGIVTSIFALYKFTEIDLTEITAVLYGLALALLIVAIYFCCLSCFVGGGVAFGSPLDIFYSLLIIAYLSCSLLVSLVQLGGGKDTRYQYAVDDYALAALIVYIKILQLLYEVLVLIFKLVVAMKQGAKKGDDL